MNYNKKMNLCIGLLLVLLTACQGAKKEVETQTPRISVSEYAMLHEVVKIKLDNVAPDMEVTVDFGDGTVETGRNNGLLTHAYTKEGDYTIKAQTATGTLAAGIHVCNLPALSVAMQQFKRPLVQEGVGHGPPGAYAGQDHSREFSQCDRGCRGRRR